MSRAQRSATLMGLALSSAAVLVLEISLTRVFAVTQFYHFAFVTVSLALLGFGASGSVLTTFPALGRGGPRRWAWLAFGQAAATVTALGLSNAIPFDSFSIAWDRLQVVYLAVTYLSLALPFFFGGAVIGVLLAGWDQKRPIGSHRVYAASLVGAGAGCLLALAVLDRTGGTGGVLAAAFLAAMAAMALAGAGRPVARTPAMAGALTAVAIAVLALAPVTYLDLRLSPYKGLSALLRIPDAEVVSTDWNTASRVDHVRSSSIRSLPGLSISYRGDLPSQEGLTFDGDDLSALPTVEPAEADFAGHMLGALPYRLRPAAAAAVLEPRGGLAVLVALANGARSVAAVEPNEIAVAAARSAGSHVYGDPRVEIIQEEPRSYIGRTGRRFDLIDVATTSPYRPITSGAYSIAEDYSHTLEAYERYLDLLAPGGILATPGWVQTPPSEEVRLVALAVEALRRRGADPARSIVALRGYASALVLVKPDGFDARELALIGQFAAEHRFDVFASPGLTADAANRFNIVPVDGYFSLAAALINEPDPEAIYRSYSFDIGPPGDDRPFFAHYFKWAQTEEVFATLGKTWQPFGGAGYFVLVAFLLLATAAALLLIVAPLLLRRARSQSTRSKSLLWWTFGYFGLLGIGFLFVEIPLIQRFILLVGRPTTAFALVLFALLVASGLGSLASRRISWTGAAVTVAVAAVLYPWLVAALTDAALAAPLWLRMVAGAGLLFPLGFLMGTMFPKGLAHLEDVGSGLTPWAWAINGTASVVSAAAAALLALSFGFRIVMLLGALCYGGCALLVRVRPAERERTTPAPVATVVSRES